MSNFKPLPQPGEAVSPTIPVGERTPNFQPFTPAAPAAQPEAAAEPEPAAANLEIQEQPAKAPRTPKATDPDVVQAFIDADLQAKGIPKPMVRGSQEWNDFRAARIAALNPQAMTQAEADARGVVEPAALRKVGLL